MTDTGKWFALTGQEVLEPATPFTRMAGHEPVIVSGTAKGLDVVLTLALMGAIEAPHQSKRQFLHLTDQIYELVAQLPEPYRSRLVEMWDDSLPELKGRY